MKKISYLFVLLLFSFLLTNCEKEEDPVTNGPVACFTYDAPVKAGVSVDFNASCSENAELYLWDFGNGETASGMNVSHTFNEPGTFDVTLTVSGADQEDAITKSIEVQNPSVNGVVYLEEDITANTTLTKDHIYVAEYNVDVQATLIIEPGTIIKFKNGAGIYCNEGQIIAEGTQSLPIIFTSIRDDVHGGDVNQDGAATVPSPGDWFWIRIAGDQNNSSFKYCHFYFAGGENDFDYALEIAGGYTEVSNCTFAYNTSEIYGALNLQECERGNTISHNTFYGNVKPLSINGFVDVDDTHIFHNPNNVTEKNMKNGIFLGNLYTEFAGNRNWSETEVPFVLSDPEFDMTIDASDNSLSIHPGVVVKMREGMAITAWEGLIKAEGSPTQPVIFTSIHDDTYLGDTENDGNITEPHPGDWNYFRIIGDNNNSVFKHCIFQYGGGEEMNDYTLILESDRTKVENNIFRYNTGFYRGTLNAEEALGNTVVANNTFYGNDMPLAIGGKLDIDASNTFHNPDNVSEKNTKNGIFVLNTYHGVTGYRSWEETEVPFVIYSPDYDFEIESGNSLTLAPNVIVKFSMGRGMSHSGNLINHDANGVWFTSYKDDTKGGDTNGDGGASQPAEGDWVGIYSNITYDYETWNNILYDEY